MARNVARRALAISALLAGRDQERAANDAGVSRRTLSRWLSEPDFQTQLQRAADALLRQARLRALAGATGALDVLDNQMKFGGNAERVRAATQWLTFAERFARDRNLERRVAQLERLFERVDSQE